MQRGQLTVEHEKQKKRPELPRGAAHVPCLKLQVGSACAGGAASRHSLLANANLQCSRYNRTELGADFSPKLRTSCGNTEGRDLVCAGTRSPSG